MEQEVCTYHSEQERLLKAGYKNIREIMSNFDHTVRGNDTEDRLKTDKVFGIYSAWDFNGTVWYEKDRFHCEVWVHHSPVEVLSADTLLELMELCSNEFGYD